MPSFNFTARDTAGRTQRGVQSAASAVVLASELRARGWLVLDIQIAAETRTGLTDALDPRGWLPVRSIDVHGEPVIHHGAQAVALQVPEREQESA